MKKAIFVLAMLGAGIPALASAAGYYVPGYVYAGSNYMYGTYNVRYNAAAAGTPYIAAYNTANSTVGFYGYDSSGNYFSCFVPTTSAMFNAATEIKNGAGSGNGTYLYIGKNTATNECNYVYSVHASYFVN